MTESVSNADTNILCTNGETRTHLTLSNYDNNNYYNNYYNITATIRPTGL